MRAAERQDPTDAHDDEAEKPQELEDLEASEDEAAGVKGGGGSTQNQTGSEPEELR